MVERRYWAKRRALVNTIAFTVFLWLGLFSILYLIAERGFPPTTTSVLSTSLVVLCAVIIFLDTCSEVYRKYYTPQIIIADTVLILRFGAIILNWTDIRRIGIGKNYFTVYREARIFSRHWEFTGNIPNNLDLAMNLEKKCAEKNIIVVKDGGV